MFPIIFNRSQLKESVANQMIHLFSEAQKHFFDLLNFLKMVIYTTLFRRWSTLKITIVLMLSNVVNIIVEIDSVDSTQRWKFQRWHTRQVSTLIWHFPTLWRHITLTTNVEMFTGYWIMLLKDYIIL